MAEHMFSVIVPSHNGEKRIRKALGSVLRQSYTDYELIVVCDDCSDRTKAIAEGFGAKTISGAWHRDGLARNAGLDAARGKWILFLDDDDWFLHESVFQMLAEVIPQLDMDVLDFAFIWKGNGYVAPLESNHLYAMAWCRAWKRDFIGENRFRDFVYGSDKEFFERMIVNNPEVRVGIWNTPMYYYNYMREGSLSDLKKKGALPKDGEGLE